MEWHLPALPFDLHPLIAEAKRRARRRRFLLGALALALAGVAVGTVLTSGAGGSPGVVPWLPTRPNLGPAHPPLAPACTASQLRATLSLEGENTTLIGDLSLTNRSARRCALVGRPHLSFAGATSSWRVTRWTGPPFLPFDPLAPPAGSLRALAPGRSVAVSLQWMSWCGQGSSSYDGDPGRPPAGIVFSAPGGGRLVLTRNRPGTGGVGLRLGTPLCFTRSTLAAARFARYVPQLGPSSELPLRARIIPSARFWNGYARVETKGLAARRGSWLSYTVVLTNRGRREFTFSRSCPAYTESIDFPREQAYVLDCRAIGAIAPRTSVRLAMRIWVPRDVSQLDNLSWTLAPHTWKAPQATTNVVVRR